MANTTTTSPRTQTRTGTLEYRSWMAMRHRCSNPKHASFKNYGGRGIRVCDRWQYSFEAFLQDMGPRPSVLFTLDRINNDGNYEPGNCRWATMHEQAHNRRSNKLLTFAGRTMCLVEWARALGISRTTLQDRFLKMGWSVEKALTKPPRRRRASHFTHQLAA